MFCALSHNLISFVLNPRNLTLLYDGVHIYGAIGSLEDRYFLGDTTQEWKECETATITDESGTMYMDWYKASQCN